MNLKKLAFFSALCFFLSAVEYAIPKPVPFFRIGLANLPVMLSFLTMSKKESSVLILLKVLLQGIIGGTLFSYIFLFSLAGSVASGFLMMAVFKFFYGRKFISWLGISMAGGLANNLAQLGVAYVFIFGDNVKFFAPVLLAVSLVASIVMGAFTEAFVEKSLWLKKISFHENVPDVGNSTNEISLKNNSCPAFAELSFCLCVAVSFIALFFSKSIYLTSAIFLLSSAACIVKEKKIKFLASLSVILSVTFFSILIPHGKILAEIWKLKITDGAVISGLDRSLKLCACVFLSKLVADKNMKLPSKAGIYMSMVFEYFEKLSEKKLDEKFSFKNLISSLDEKLNSVYDC